MAMAFSLGQAETYIREIIMKIFEAVSDRCIGMMEVITKENGSMEFNMEKDSFLSQAKAQKKDFSRIIYLSRFIKSSLYRNLHLKCGQELYIKIYQPIYRQSKKNSIIEAWMGGEK